LFTAQKSDFFYLIWLFQAENCLLDAILIVYAIIW